MQQILYLIQKEFRQIFRDRFMIRLLFFMPIIQLIILGYAVTTDVYHLKTVVYDGDRTPMSREFLRQFTHSEYFDLVYIEDKYTVLPSYLDDGTAKLVVIIPSGFQRGIIRKEKPTIQILLDGLDGNTTGIAMGYMQALAQKYHIDVMSETPVLASAFKETRTVSTETRFWYNPNLESRTYIIPGIIALILTVITVFLTSMGIVREKEIGTLEQLMVTPIRAYQLILGKTIPFCILGFVEILLAIGLIWIIFGIGIQGSLLLLLFESLLFVLTTLGLGIFLSTVAETQQQALFTGWFFMIFAMLLSGFFIPIPNMPDVIQALTYLNPLRYFLLIIREIYLKGTTLPDLIPETLAMIVFGIVVFGLAVILFRRKLA